MPGATVRTVPVADRGPVTIRLSGSADAPGLLALFESLSDHDRYYRFFSPIAPSLRLARRWATLAERGGCGLVATIPATGGERIVGEAGYAILPDGTGEFAITVAPDWRGWLGPVLLSALLSEADKRGIPILAADILAENRGMLGLVGWRGYAATEHLGDRVRVVLPTSGTVPQWPESLAGPRVVVEAPGARWPAAMQAQSSGINVMVCPGPRGRHGGIRCPELRGEPCPLVRGADAVVVALPSSAPGDDRDQLVMAHRTHRRDLPVFVAGPRGTGLPPDVRRLSSDLSDEEVVDALQEALGGDHERTSLVRLLGMLRPLTGLLRRTHHRRPPPAAASSGEVGQRQQSPTDQGDGPVV